MGYSSLEANIIGTRNTAIGYQALLANTDGSGNTATGYQALLSNTDGSANTCIGYDAGSKITTGCFNTCLGWGAGSLAFFSSGPGHAIIDGSMNVMIGAGATPVLVGPAGFENRIAIGYGAQSGANNRAVLGNASMTSIGGYVNWSNFSDLRLKKNIINNDLGLDFINKLHPIKYNKVNPIDYPEELLPNIFKGDNPDLRPKDDPLVYDGLIAQEVEEVLQQLGKTCSCFVGAENNGMLGIRYGTLTVPLIKAVQELHQELIAEKAKNVALEARLVAIEAKLME